MTTERRLDDDELIAARHAYLEAKASLACEGIILTAAEEALFARFEAERLPHEDCRRQIIAFCLDRAAEDMRAAE